MALVVAILGAIGQPIVATGQCLWDLFIRQIGYVKNLEKDFEKLKEKTIDLKKILEDVETEINRDTLLKKPSNQCQFWLQRAREMENKVNAIEAEFQENKRCCIGGLCPNIWWRRNLCKKIVEMIDDIVNVNLKGEMFSGTYVVVDIPRQSVEPFPAPIIEGNTSINYTVQKISRCIRNDDIQKIGLWGMGGVGKTTSMKVINNLPEIKGMFDMVIWVTVSKDGGIRKVQKDIIERLSLNFDDNESVERTARKIFQRLSNMKYLLLLDDLWRRMDLDIIGIPNPSKENGCKMIITSRSMVVCNKMEIDETIKVEVLSEEEAWNLFRKKVGNVVDSQDIREIATQVVRECQGLPLAIIVIGGCLRNKSDLSEWRNAWMELSSNRYEIFDDMEESVFKILKFSYDHLKSDNMKNCFLYCALYPEDYQIPETELIQRWWAEGFIDGALSLNAEYDRGHAIINYLKMVSLLEGDDLQQLVKMHDMIRDLALIITSSSTSTSFSATMVREDGNKFLVRTNIGIEELSNEEDWGQLRRISLTYGKFCNLPANPTSHELVTLFLQHNENLTRIPESFFKHMHNLRVLDLSYTNVEELPSSVSNLVSLRGLYLLQCPSLVTVPSEIGNLKKLLVLHLGGKRGNFKYLPIEIQQLTLLRSLQVSFIGASGNRLMVPNGIITMLSLLEDLSIHVDTLRYQSPKLGKSIAVEVASLKQLTQLEFRFTTLESFEHFVHESCPWKNQSLKSFRFIVECNSEKQLDPIRDSAEEASNMQYLRLLGGNYTPTVFAEVLRRASGFHLQGHQTSQGLLEFGLENLNQLKLCVVCDCNMMEIIINGNDFSSTSAVLPNLEYLEVSNMPTMKAIWEGPMPPGSFSCLACLQIRRCENLRKIFTRGSLQQLPNLEKLFISFCQTVQVIVNAEEEGQDVVLFPKLKILTLSKLPSLEKIWETVSFPLAPSLETLRVLECPNFKSLPLSLGIQKIGSSTSSLRRIEGESQWWEALKWEHDEIKQQFQPFFFSSSW